MKDGRKVRKTPPDTQTSSGDVIVALLPPATVSELLLSATGSHQIATLGKRYKLLAQVYSVDPEPQ